MRIEDVEDAVCAVLYLEHEDFDQGTDTDLRDLGLDSLRLIILLDRLGIDQSPTVFERITAQPTVDTLFDIACCAMDREA